MLQFDLAPQIGALCHEAGWRGHGHTAKTLVKHRDVSIVLIAMKKGTRMDEHQARGGISIHALIGRLELHVGDKTIDLPAGSLLALERAQPHEVEALDDSFFLLYVCGEETAPVAGNR